ncbi:MAG TPA: dynamin family protein [Aggregatilinea sp.]|uniref:dynamin family protein n=1 Tax=Aggregatilinea sp. TaxID=2806333 RepID=UPI002CCFDC1C|nr:dynamin family protein [Aggregatilinea sp.]HML20790.1 dynamin family protein [Aggregatilinea sp.]
MANIVLEGPIASVREREVRLLSDLAGTVSEISGSEAEDKKRLQQNAIDLQDMFFLVVVVGEFNAGKSTFVNALLGDELLPMGITPTTDAIELVRWSSKPGKEPQWREPGIVREWSHPNTGGPGVVIVDTPGTGSVFRKHETIAKNFLSRSDLVIFLISAKRALAETERLYLELARDYGKKIVVIINQADLLEKREQKEVQAFVQQQLRELLDLRPDIFMISAKQALRGRTGGGLFSSTANNPGEMNAVRDYLKTTFQRVPPAKQKLLAQLDFADSMVRKYLDHLDKSLGLISSDTALAQSLRQELEQQAGTLNDQLNTSKRELDTVFLELKARGRAFIRETLTIQNATQAMDRDEMRDKFEKQVVGNAMEQITRISEDYVNAVVDNSRRYWRSILDRLTKLESMMDKDVSAVDATGYAEQRAALQEAIAIADAELKSYTNDSLAENLRNTFRTNLVGFSAGFTFALGGIIAVVLGLAAPGAVTAATGAIVATFVVGPVLLLGGGAAAVLYWRKIKRDATSELERRLDALQASYHQSMLDLTNRERNRMLQYGQQILSPVFSQLTVLSDRYKAQKTALETYGEQAKDLRREVNAIQIVVEG